MPDTTTINPTAALGMASLGGTPRLVLHIEADSFAELLDALDQVMGGLTPGLYATATEEYDDGHARANVSVYATPGEAQAAQAAAPKRGRGRPPKVAPPAPVAAPAAATYPPQPAMNSVAPADANDVTTIAQQPFTPPATSAPSAPSAPSAAMTNLSPADARKKGIDLITAHFAAHPEVLPQVQAISQKYGVQQFADIPDDKAHAFLADITLLTNGTGQV